MIIRGVDTLEFGLDIAMYEMSMRPFLIGLRELKENGQQTGKSMEIELNGLNLNVEKSGMPFYAYRLTCKDFIIGFAEKTIQENPPVRVKFLSGYLWSYGYEKAYEKFLEWFQCFGLKVTGSRLSRLDICVDTDEVEFVPEDIQHVVTRAKSKATHFVSDEYITGRMFSGFTIGRGNPMLARIYNKSEEIKKSGKEWFKDIWLENGWNEIKDSWRVEFQIKREALKEMGLGSVEDIQRNEEKMWCYLTNDWLKLKVNKWAKIANPVPYETTPLVRSKVIKGDLKRILNQTNGLLISIGALSSNVYIDEVLSLLKKWNNKKLQNNQTCFKMEVEKRRKMYL